MPWNMPRPGGTRLGSLMLSSPPATSTRSEMRPRFERIEIIEHVAQAIARHELQHDGVTDFLAGVELCLLASDRSG